MGTDDVAWRIVSALPDDPAGRTPLAQAVVAWARSNAAALDLGKRGRSIDWPTLHKKAAKRAGKAGAHPLRARLDHVGEALALERVDQELLWFAVAVQRVESARKLASALADHGAEPVTLFAARLGLAPEETRDRLNRGDLTRLGLVSVSLAKGGQLMASPNWTLSRVLDLPLQDPKDAAEALIGRRQAGTLPLDAFARIAADADLLVRLLRGAADGGEIGINILIHGPPGTGKTELARTVADAARGNLFSVGEADEYGEEPTRWDRVTAYRLAQRLAARRPRTMLLFDEMEDLIGDMQRGPGDAFTGREGSKIFFNRLLEANVAPTIWTTNALCNIDPAILRRMSFVLKLDYPGRDAAREMLERIAVEERFDAGGAILHALTAEAPEASAVLRNALRTARVAGQGEADASRAARSLTVAVRGGAPLPAAIADPSALDLSLYEADRDIAALIERLASPHSRSDFSLLLTGPPGTGKTALAQHLAWRMGRPLIVKRASDLLSKWLGGTEKRIAAAFEEARASNGVLLFDEVDSLLFDRGTATRTWEVTQVNELLTWFDNHPLPFLAATNHGKALDPAALRRFVFKLDLRPLSAESAAATWARFFTMPAPLGLERLRGLTPGDFAVVARQLRFESATPEAGQILAALEAELAAKPEGGSRIGF